MVAIAFVAFFSLFPDLLHLGDLRMIGHSLIGPPILMAMAFGALWALFRTRPIFMGIVVAAVTSHLLADLLMRSMAPAPSRLQIIVGTRAGHRFRPPGGDRAHGDGLGGPCPTGIPFGQYRSGPLVLQERNDEPPADPVPLHPHGRCRGSLLSAVQLPVIAGLMTVALVIDFLLLFVGFSFLFLYTLDARSRPSADQGGRETPMAGRAGMSVIFEFAPATKARSF